MRVEQIKQREGDMKRLEKGGGEWRHEGCGGKSGRVLVMI